MKDDMILDIEEYKGNWNFVYTGLRREVPRKVF